MEMIDVSRIWRGWRIAGLVGQGSFGSVYRIEKDDLGIVTSCALKVVQIPHDDSELQELSSQGMDEQSIRTFYRSRLEHITDEIRAMESLKSAPNIVTIDDHYIEEKADGVGWTIYIKMEYLTPLDQYAKWKGELGEAEVVRLGEDILTALCYCERMHIIHRDIKPSNVFMDKFGSYKLGDFGIARFFTEGNSSAFSVKGTPWYMAPEVRRGQKYHSNVDLYSLGMMMYRYLNHNRYPFEPPTGVPIYPADIENAMNRCLVGDRKPFPGGASRQIGEVVLKACQADPAKRYQTAEEMLADLKAAEKGIAPGQYGQTGRSVKADSEATIPESTGSVGERDPYIGWEKSFNGSRSGYHTDTGRGSSSPAESGHSGSHTGIIIGVTAAICLAILGAALLLKANKNTTIVPEEESRKASEKASEKESQKLSEQESEKAEQAALAKATDETGTFKYAVALYGIEVDTVIVGGNETTGGLTFGPAYGENYVTSYKTHMPSGQTSSGNDHRCIHDDNWAQIAWWSETDPYVYEQCIDEGCTKSVPLNENTTTTLFNSSFDGAQETGDGPSALYYELMQSENNYENLMWNPDGKNGTNEGGWGASRIRAMLNGADDLTDTGTSEFSSFDSGYAVNKSASVYTDTNCLLAMFPETLQEAIATKAVKYDSVFYDKTESNLKTSNDRLWLLSSNELYTDSYLKQNDKIYHPLEGSVYPKYENVSGYKGRVPYHVDDYAGGSSGSSLWAWLRSSYGSYDTGVLYVSRDGSAKGHGAHLYNAVSPCFTLK